MSCQWCGGTGYRRPEMTPPQGKCSHPSHWRPGPADDGDLAYDRRKDDRLTEARDG